MVVRKDKERSLFSMDKWTSAPRERMALIQFLADRRVPNPVVLTGDIHSNWVNDLRVDDRIADTSVVATEFVCSSLSSGGNGIAEPQGLADILANNAGVKFHNQERGYTRCTITPDAWTSDFVVVEDVIKPHGKIITRASYVVEAGKPGAVKAS
jgi:alkaline phosphatase D